MRSIPKDESASAAPDFEESLRFPCLATGTPAPATTKAVAVEMLRVPFPSPPVPTMSIAPSGARTRCIFARITDAAAAISVTVSPRVRRAMRKPAICAGEAAPSNSVRKACSASPFVNPRIIAASISPLIPANTCSFSTDVFPVRSPARARGLPKLAGAETRGEKPHQRAGTCSMLRRQLLACQRSCRPFE